jgi:hypothetical protein
MTGSSISQPVEVQSHTLLLLAAKKRRESAFKSAHATCETKIHDCLYLFAVMSSLLGSCCSLVFDVLLVLGLVLGTLLQQRLERVTLQERVICCIQLLLLAS